MGFVSTDPDIDGLQSGTYRLTVRDAKGCQNTRSVDIIRDQLPPEVQLFGETLSCRQQVAEVYFTTGLGLDTYFWRTPGNMILSDSAFMTAEPGTYLFFSRGRNGCTSIDTLEVNVDTLSPERVLISGTINCRSRSTNIFLDDYQGVQLVEWKLPDGRSTFGDTLDVSSAGYYTAVLTGENGCVFIDSIEVFADTLAPLLQAIGDTIDCIDRSGRLSVIPGGNVADWTVAGPEGPFNNMTNMTVRTPGIYSIIWIGLNGCSDSLDVRVWADTIAPQVVLELEQFDCRDKDTVALGVVSVVPGATYRWNGPGGFVSMSADTLTMTPGIYTLTVTGENGCMTTRNGEIGFDTIPPAWAYVLPIDTLTCDRDSVDLVVTALSGPMRFAFDAPGGGRLLNDSTWRTGSAGVIAVLAEGRNACITIDSTEIPIDTLSPILALSSDSITCRIPEVRLRSIVMPSGGGYAWTGPGGFISSQSSPVVNIGGIYTLEYSLPNGCKEQADIFVFENNEPPMIRLTGGPLPCDGRPAVLSASSGDRLIALNWEGPGFRGTGDSVMVVSPGWYFLEAIGANGCVSLDSIFIDFPSSNLPFAIVGDTLNCRQRSVQLRVDTSYPMSSKEWIFPDGSAEIGEEITVVEGGWYTLTVTDSLGCKGVDSFFVVTDTVAPFATIVQQGSLACGSRTLDLIAILQGDPNEKNWSWFDPGDVEFGNGVQRVTINLPGQYRLEVTDRKNGCTSVERVSVSDSGSVITAFWSGLPPVCPGEQTGRLQLDSIQGATGPWALEVNGQGLGQSTSVSGLSAGTYLLQIIDSLGCSWSDQIILDPPDSFWVELGPDRSINLGEQVLLRPSYNPGASGPSVLSWDPPDPACPQCDERTVSPTRDTRYGITVRDDRGCIATDFLWVRVRQVTPVFLPNAFTPNGDGINDGWSISINDSVIGLKRLRIFDRWGSLVYALDDQTLADGLELWDGSSDGKPLNPAVFAYFIELELANGKILPLYGDVTLVR